MSDYEYTPHENRNHEHFGERLLRVAKNMAATGSILTNAGEREGANMAFPAEVTTEMKSVQMMTIHADEDGREYWIDTDGKRHYMLSREQIDSAFERKAAKQVYSHRNGETEPPTVHGWYWVKGTVVVKGETINIYDCLVIKHWLDSSMLTRLGDGQFVTLIAESSVWPLGEWHCQWYGPVLPPWEQDNAV